MDHIRILRNKIASGRLVKGFFLTLSDPVVGEIAGFAGYDYVWIDAEHGALDRQEILHHIMAAQGAGCAAFVRVRRPLIFEIHFGYGARWDHLPVLQRCRHRTPGRGRLLLPG